MILSKAEGSIPTILTRAGNNKIYGMIINIMGRHLK
jgi:hypothetical protein